MTTGKTIALTRWTFVGKVTSLLFIVLSRFVIAFLPRSKHLLISWLQSPIYSDFGAQKTKSVIVSPSMCHEVMRLDAMLFFFWMLSFKPTFSLTSFTFSKRLFSSSLLSAIKVVSSAYLRLLIFVWMDVWIWELDYKESWAPKNWCFWTVVLEKTSESLGLQGDPTSPF